MGSAAFQAYIRNLQRITLGQMLDTQMLANHQWKLSIGHAPVRVPRGEIVQPAPRHD